MKYDLVVAYRIYPKISKVPAAFPSDKYKLSKLCLESFKKATAGLRVKMIVLLDSCPPEYASLFEENFAQEDLELISVQNLGNKGSFKRQIDILSSQNDSEIVYFAEDDYFYIKNITELVNIIRTGVADFVTPYEHPECYSKNHVISNKLFLINGMKYATVQHSCCTFMTSKQKLIQMRRYLLIYPDWFASDYTMWACITLGSDFFRYTKVLLHPQKLTLEDLKVYGVMWFFAWHRFIFNRRNKLLMPIGAFATHMEKDFLSPGIDWGVYFKNTQ